MTKNYSATYVRTISIMSVRGTYLHTKSITSMSNIREISGGDQKEAFPLFSVPYEVQRASMNVHYPLTNDII